MIQNDFETIGKYGCYFLCICHAFGVKDDDVYIYYKMAVRMGFIGKECFVNDPASLAKMIIGKTVAVRKSDKESDAKIKIAYFYNPNTRLHHFVVKEGDGWWDPYGESRTRKEGFIESWRLFTY